MLTCARNASVVAAAAAAAAGLKTSPGRGGSADMATCARSRWPSEYGRLHHRSGGGGGGGDGAHQANHVTRYSISKASVGQHHNLDRGRGNVPRLPLRRFVWPTWSSGPVQQLLPTVVALPSMRAWQQRVVVPRLDVGGLIPELEHARKNAGICAAPGHHATAAGTPAEMAKQFETHARPGLFPPRQVFTEARRALAQAICGLLFVACRVAARAISAMYLASAGSSPCAGICSALGARQADGRWSPRGHCRKVGHAMLGRNAPGAK